MKKVKLLIVTIIVIIVCIIILGVMQTKNTLNSKLNLSQYTSHGEISCNRIWVEKTKKSGENVYAYLDTEGNVIYGWNKANEGTKYRDYNNNYAIIIEEGDTDSDIFTIIDINGNKVLGDNVLRVKYLLTNDKKEKEYWYQDFSEEGYAYIVGYIEGKETEYSNKPDIFFVNSNGLHKFKVNATFREDTYNVLVKHIKKIGKYFFMQCDNTSLLMNEEGKQLLDFWQVCNINPFDIEIISDNEIKLYYWEGVLVYAKYWCIIDFEGNIIHEPELIKP